VIHFFSARLETFTPPFTIWRNPS